MAAFSRSVIFLLVSLLAFTVAMAMLNTLVPLWLTHEGLATLPIGIVSSGFFLGNLIGTLVAGYFIYYVGFNRSFYLATLVFILSTLALMLSYHFISWTVWRLFSGIACAAVWVIVESALLLSGTLKTRGLLLAAYMMVYYLASVLGQLFINIAPNELDAIMPWLVAMLIAGMLPQLFVKLPRITTLPNQRMLLQMVKIKEARVGILGCVISGIILGTLYSLMPVYLSHAHFTNSQVAYAMAILIGAGILGQFPMGRLAARRGRLPVLQIQSLSIVLMALAVLVVPNSLFVALLMLGCFSFTLYPLTMAWACEQVDVRHIVPMNQTLLLNYTIGSLIGPTMTATAMQWYGDSALFIIIMLSALFYLFVLLIYRKRHTITKKPLLV